MRHCEHCGSEVSDQAVACPHCGKPLAPAAGQPRKKGSSGPIIAVVLGCGCLGAIAVVGILAAILVPNFLDALHRGRQKRTMGELRELGVSLASYATDSETLSYPQAASPEELTSRLVPDYLAAVPAADGWGHPIRYACWQEDPGHEGCDTFRLASAGRDGRFEREDLRDYGGEAFAPTDYDRDIVFALSGFIQYPAGAPP
jgi:type II secretory pathway pseudopilin PulG